MFRLKNERNQHQHVAKFYEFRRRKKIDVSVHSSFCCLDWSNASVLWQWTRLVMLAYVRRAWNEHDTVELYCVGNGHKVKSATIEFDDKFKMTSDHMGATIWMSSHNKWKQKEKSEMDIRHLLNQFYKLRMLFHRKANVVLQLALTLLSYKFFVQLFLLFLIRKNAFQLNEKRFFVTAKSWFQFLWVKWDNNFFLLATIFLWWFCCVANIGYVSKKFSIEFSSSATFYSLSFILVNLNNAFHVFSKQNNFRYLLRCMATGWIGTAEFMCGILINASRTNERTHTIHNNYYATDVNHKFQFK